MTALFTIPAVQALAWTLVHFLWQGAAIGVLFFLWLRLRRPAAQARYSAGILALTALLAAPVATFSSLAMAVPGEPVVVVAPAAGTVPRAVDAGTAPVVPILPADSRAPAAPDPGATARQVAAVTIVTLWAAGVLLLSLRLAGGWIVARRIAARAAQPAAGEVLTLAAALSSRSGRGR